MIERVIGIKALAQFQNCAAIRAKTLAEAKERAVSTDCGGPGWSI